MSSERMDQLFDINKKSSDDSGTGLGLILSKEFMEKNGGSLRIESEEGVGTKVCMIFETGDH
jgi:signal transduction histidine kinase